MKNIIRFLFAVTLGVLYGIFFAQKSGKKLRAELKKSQHPCQDLFQELRSVDMEALGYVKDWAGNSKEVQKISQLGKDHFQALVQKANELGGEAREHALETLDEIAQNAKDAAQDLKKKASEKGKDLLKQVKK